MDDNRQLMCEEKGPITEELLSKMDAWWRAANYLSAGQLYLLENPLLRRPLTRDMVKKKIVGHWGTVPGQNFVFVHLNRVIKRYDLDMILLSGPGHGGNFYIANDYMDGSYSEIYPNISEDEDGMARMFKQFSFPGGMPSHCAPETPGSINEGGELGYGLAHGFGAGSDRGGHRRRRRSGDRTAGDILAVQQVPESDRGRRGPADPAPERIQDREPDPVRAHEP